MAAKPLSSEAIAMTEKKMDMTLDDIIKMSKNNTSKAKKQRVSNRSQKFNNAAQEKSNKVLRFMETRSSLRQGTLARRRSNFQGNQFPLAAEAARKAAVAPIRNRAFNRGRGYNMNKPRFVARPVQRNVSNGSFTIKHPQPQVNMTPKQRPQTLDSLFANMKEQRMRVFSQQNNAGRRNGGGGGQRRQQWGRGRYGN